MPKTFAPKKRNFPPIIFNADYNKNINTGVFLQ